MSKSLVQSLREAADTLMNSITPTMTPLTFANKASIHLTLTQAADHIEAQERVAKLAVSGPAPSPTIDPLTTIAADMEKIGAHDYVRDPWNAVDDMRAVARAVAAIVEIVARQTASGDGEP